MSPTWPPELTDREREMVELYRRCALIANQMLYTPGSSHYQWEQPALTALLVVIDLNRRETVDRIDRLEHECRADEVKIDAELKALHERITSLENFARGV